MAAARQVPMGLDLHEQQVAVDFEDDDAFLWHHRVLFERVGDQGRWVACSPDGELEVLDLADHRVIPIPRGGPVPQRVQDLYTFAGPVPEDDLLALRRDAKALASMLGAGPAAAGGASSSSAAWYYSDLSREDFGTEVAGEVFRNPLNVVMRDSVGLVHTDDGYGGLSWTMMERVQSGDLDAWREEKVTGPSRDPRILPLERDAKGGRYCGLKDLLAQFGEFKTAPPDWPFRGPPATMELLRSIRAAGEGFGGFHEYYCRNSGLVADSPVGVKHRDLISVLHHLLAFDQLNAPQLSGVELVCRMVLQIHAATKKFPKNPDFRGTALMIMTALDASGGILTGDFAKFVAEEQKAEAFTLKQQRLFAEEEGHRSKRDGGGGGGGKEKSGGGAKSAAAGT